MARPSHEIEQAATALRRAAATLGIELSTRYVWAVTADGLSREREIALNRLADGVVIHTVPRTRDRLPIVIGYADHRGQWYRDGHRHVEAPAGDESAPAMEIGR